MSDGVTLFHANHNNLESSGSALTAASVGAGRTAMRTQKDGKAYDNLGKRRGIKTYLKYHIYIC